MHLSVTVDHRADGLEIGLVMVEVGLDFPGIQETRLDFTDLPDNQELVAILSDIPGTYDEFPERFIRLAEARGFNPEKIKVVTRSDPDYWE